MDTVLGTGLGAANGAALEPTRAMEPIRPNRRATPHPSTNNAVQTTANIAKCLPSFPEILILCLFKGCFLDFQLQTRKAVEAQSFSSNRKLPQLGVRITMIKLSLIYRLRNLHIQPWRFSAWDEDTKGGFVPRLFLGEVP